MLLNTPSNENLNNNSTQHTLLEVEKSDPNQTTFSRLIFSLWCVHVVELGVVSASQALPAVARAASVRPCFGAQMTDLFAQTRYEKARKLEVDYISGLVLLFPRRSCPPIFQIALFCSCSLAPLSKSFYSGSSVLQWLGGLIRWVGCEYIS